VLVRVPSHQNIHPQLAMKEGKATLVSPGDDLCDSNDFITLCSVEGTLRNDEDGWEQVSDSGAKNYVKVVCMRGIVLPCSYYSPLLQARSQVLCLKLIALHHFIGLPI